MILNSLHHFERCRTARNMEADLICARLKGREATEAFRKLEMEADEDYRQLPQLLVQQSRLVH